MNGGGIYQIVGKTIDRVIIKHNKSDWGRPAIQVFLIFTDHTYYEIYTPDSMNFTGGVDRGGRNEVVHYLSDAMNIVYEGALNENGEPTII